MTEEDARKIFEGLARHNDEERFTLEQLRTEANKFVSIEAGVP